MKAKIFLPLLSLVICCLLSLPTQAQTQVANYVYTPADSVGYISQMTGIVSTIANMYVITPEGKEGARYYVKNLDDAFKQEGMRVQFSAVQLRIPPNVRMVGTPVYIRSIAPFTTNASPKTVPQKKGRMTKATPMNGHQSPNRPTGIHNAPRATKATSPATASSPGAMVTDVEGVISKVGDYFVITVPNGTRYFPQNLPDNFRYPNVRVRISGTIGEIPPNVRMVGTPLMINRITRITPPKRHKSNSSWGEWKQLD